MLTRSILNCKSSIDKNDLDEYFKDMNKEEDQNTDSKKSIAENYHSIGWNRKRTKELQRFYQSGSLKMQCMMSGGNSFPGRWDNISQPKTTQKYDPAPSCIKDAANEDIELRSEDEPEPKMDEDDADNLKSLQKKSSFSLNSFSDDWADYSSWGVDKRGDTQSAEKRGMGHSHMGKRRLGSM